MYNTVFISLFLMFLVCGCDPIGLRRVDLQFHSPGLEGSRISVDSPDIQESLKILDSVLVRHGLQVAQKQPGYIRVYTLAHVPAKIDSVIYSSPISCRFPLTSTGIEVTFGEPGFLAANPLAERLLKDVRAAFIKRYGKQQVRSHRFGGRNTDGTQP